MAMSKQFRQNEGQSSRHHTHPTDNKAPGCPAVQHTAQFFPQTGEAEIVL